MKKAIKGHFGALRFTQKTTAAVLALLLAASVTACSGTQDSADTDTTVTTEEVGFKGGDVFVTDGYLSEVIYPIKENMVNYAVSLMESIYNSYLADGNHRVVVSVVPDKNIALHEAYYETDPAFSDALLLPYAEISHIVREGTKSFALYHDIMSTLSLSAYYYTDMHWRQEYLTETAASIHDIFGLPLEFQAAAEPFTAHPFVGSYTEDPLMADAKVDTLYYLMNETLEQVRVTDYVNGIPQEGVLYNTDITADQKSYDLFLSGPMPLQVLESPLAKTDRELIIFRDSFGSSIAPYFCEQYARVTLVDLRYLNSGVLGDFIDFDDQDILFLYSTHILNTAMIMK